MATKDRYPNLAELARWERDGLDYRQIVKVRPSAVAVLAPHGGGIEPGTSEVAFKLAGPDLSLYCFEGLKPRGSQRLHITSTRFDAPACLDVAGRSWTVVAVHGCEGRKPEVYVGGLDAALAKRIVGALRAAGFRADCDTTFHSGSHPANICNRGQSGRGVQLELSEGLRRSFFKGLKRDERAFATDALARFINALRPVLLAVAVEERP